MRINGDFKIAITYEDGLVAELDFKSHVEKMHGPIAEPLADEISSPRLSSITGSSHGPTDSISARTCSGFGVRKDGFAGGRNQCALFRFRDRMNPFSSRPPVFVP